MCLSGAGGGHLVHLPPTYLHSCISSTQLLDLLQYLNPGSSLQSLSGCSVYHVVQMSRPRASPLFLVVVYMSLTPSFAVLQVNNSSPSQFHAMSSSIVACLLFKSSLPPSLFLLQALSWSPALRLDHHLITCPAQPETPFSNLRQLSRITQLLGLHSYKKILVKSNCTSVQYLSTHT